MKNAGMVLPAVDHVYPKTSFDNTSDRLTLRSIKKSSSTNTKSESVVGGVEGFQKCLAAKETSERAANIISNSKRGNSVSSHELAMIKSSWCSGQKVDSFRCSLSYVLEFLAEIFEKGFAHRTARVHLVSHLSLS